MIESLVGPNVTPSPRRTVSGLDPARLSMVLAVLQRRSFFKLHERDVFASTVGGIRVVEPAVDLGLAVAVASAIADHPVPSDLVVMGEVGLTGEVRRVGAPGRRLAEAARLGFRTALVPAGCGPAAIGGAPAGMQVFEVATVKAALQNALTLSATGS